MSNPIQHPEETRSNAHRKLLSQFEPKSLRTFTPTQAVLAKSAGVFHWTPEGRRLYDFSSGVLVANLGHNPLPWMRRFSQYMGWPETLPGGNGYFSALPMTAYNASTPVESAVSRQLIELLQSRPGGQRLEQVMWAASGSEAIQKALWAALARDRSAAHDPGDAVRLPRQEGTGRRRHRLRNRPRPRSTRALHQLPDGGMPGREHCAVPRLIALPYLRELEETWRQVRAGRIGTLITEPYLGGGGSYHPPKAYLQLLQRFCREHDVVFILDEVQSNFGRTGKMFAYETYGLEPDVVVLGKGLGNGVPVAAVVGRRDLFAALDYGEGSDTWSANPLCCAAVLATLQSFAEQDVLDAARRSSAIIERGLLRLKDFPFVANVRGEEGGMVWGVEMCDHAGRAAAEWANRCVLACYLGAGGDGLHLLGPLAKKVLRIAPPLTITEAEATAALELMHRLFASLAAQAS